MGDLFPPPTSENPTASGSGGAHAVAATDARSDVGDDNPIIIVPGTAPASGGHFQFLARNKILKYVCVCAASMLTCFVQGSLLAFNVSSCVPLVVRRCWSWW